MAHFFIIDVIKCVKNDGTRLVQNLADFYAYSHTLPVMILIPVEKHRIMTKISIFKKEN